MDRGSAVAPEPLILRALGPAAGPVLLSRLTPRQSSGLPTVLVSMPFMDAGRPSIQLGLLTAIARAQGFPVESLHANLDFAARIGIDYYKRISEHRGAMLGDWLFSREAFLDRAPDVDGRLIDDLADDLPRGSGSAADAREKLLRMRDTDVPRYLDDLVDEILSGGARVVGFSSTFQQNAASFALARRLKQRRPDIVTIFGGANFDGEMGPEFLRVLDFIDYAVVGEGDLAFPRMLAALAAGTDPGLVPGVARRVDGDVGVTSPEPPFDRMDDLPAPDYAEYFRRAQALGLITAKAHRNTPIPFESSRGCWWGAKHHCTFCGLNGSSMAFRSKSADRVAQELAELTRRYHSFSFEAVDNIMDVNHLKSLLPTLINDRTDYRIFYEVKANLTRDQIRMMAQAGITAIQPGLESMSSRVLSLMRKGVRAAQNINVLRWALYYGIDVSWNILWGFPGESEQDYVEQATVLGHLTHLQPPTSAGPIWMERFSPLFSNSDEFPMRYRAPERSYAYIYPESMNLEQIAYFFEYELKDPLPSSVYAGVDQVVRSWSHDWKAGKPPVLTYWSAPGLLQIYDGRHRGSEGTYTFEGEVAETYLACSDRPISESAVRERCGIGMSVEKVHEVMVGFAGRGLMFLDGTQALALALPSVRGR